MKIPELAYKIFFKNICLSAILSCSLISFSFGQSDPVVYNGSQVKNQIILKLKSNFNFSIDQSLRNLGISELDKTDDGRLLDILESNINSVLHENKLVLFLTGSSHTFS